MNTKSYFRFFTVLFLFLFLNVVFSKAQTAKSAAPRQEKLLNGMNLLVWNEPNAAKITVKLRVHSGSAFDTQNKEGTMALLADILFPTAAQKEFFSEDLGGSLEVTSNYDYIQIDATANTEQFLTMMETLSNAVINPQIDKETTAKVRAARLEKLRELEKNPAYIADQAVARRLFGDFPYGRPQTGMSDSVAKIDFADLLLAKQRFLTADNATLAIVGNVKPDLAYRAARRFFGAWTQADKRVPATFRQPDAPDAKLFLINSDAENASELRFAFRGLARGDNDFAASQVLVKILQNRLQSLEGANAVVRQDAHLLPGFVLWQIPNRRGGAIQVEGEKVAPPANFSGYVAGLVKKEIKPEEVQNAKSALNNNPPDAVNLWLDVQTFKLGSVKDEMQKPDNVTVSDVQRVAERWLKEPVATVLVVKTSK